VFGDCIVQKRRARQQKILIFLGSVWWLVEEAEEEVRMRMRHLVYHEEFGVEQVADVFVERKLRLQYPHVPHLVTIVARPQTVPTSKEGL